MSSEKFQAIIFEYQMLRDEIKQRSDSQMRCIIASVVSIGALISLVAQNPLKNSIGLIIIPWILAVFGIIWLDHNNRIFEIGQYLREEIEEKKLPKILDSNEVNWVGWQYYLSEKRERWRLPSKIVFILPFLYFVFPSIACVIAYITLSIYNVTTLPELIKCFFWVIGILLIIILSFSWYKSYEITRKR